MKVIAVARSLIRISVLESIVITVGDDACIAGGVAACQGRRHLGGDVVVVVIANIARCD